MTDTTIKTIRIIPFSGNEEDWNRWSKTFMATATMKGYRDVLSPIDPDEDATIEDNVQAYNDLILSCQEDISFGIIDESISETSRMEMQGWLGKIYATGMNPAPEQRRFKLSKNFINSS